MTDIRPAITGDGTATGVILFAHGARDARWAEPFARVADKVRAGAPALAVKTAFLEFMTPDLATAAARLVQKGVSRIRVIPLFFGRGGHLITEIPRLVADIARSLPGVDIELALAAFCLAEASVH